MYRTSADPTPGPTKNPYRRWVHVGYLTIVCVGIVWLGATPAVAYFGGILPWLVGTIALHTAMALYGEMVERMMLWERMYGG